MTKPTIDAINTVVRMMEFGYPLYMAKVGIEEMSTQYGEDEYGYTIEVRQFLAIATKSRTKKQFTTNLKKAMDVVKSL